MPTSESIIKLLRQVGVVDPIVLTAPPKPEMGDLAFACFSIAKEWKKNPVHVAQELAEKLSVVILAKAGIRDIEILDSRLHGNDKVIEKIEAFGPYVNFFLNAKELAKIVLTAVEKKDYGSGKLGKGRKIMVEYAQPNTHKSFHIGHLRNIITGESLSRIFDNVGYKVFRANYQGDVGLHIAKCFWGIFQSQTEYEAVKNKSVKEKAEFLGRVYAMGGQAYETNEQAKMEIVAINEKIYAKDKEIYKIYKETREWSLEYFDHIYKRLGVKFDRLYFESETFVEGKKIVLENLKKGIFKESDGAVIFEGEKFGLHSRVFLNGKGLPTYEAKDLALAKAQLREKTEKIFHVVGKEQTEYFKVVFKAIESVFPKSAGVENHLVYGWVSLKEGKMSSRAGNVILGEWLLDEVKKKVSEVMKGHDMMDRDNVEEKVAVAAVKYAFLRTGAQNDIIFSINESISLTGDSGPYLLYIVARIKSIFRKFDKKLQKIIVPEKIEPAEKKLLNCLSGFVEAAEKASIEKDPSKIAHYLLELAQDFNNFYALCPILKAEEKISQFRLHLAKAVETTMIQGLYLLGIEAVEEM